MLLGLQIDWSTPVWEDIAANGLPDDPEDGEATPEGAKRAAVFGRWRMAVFEVSEGCVPLALVPPSEVAAEIADFLDEAGEQAGIIEEIREFIAMARREARGEEVVCRPEVVGNGLELSLYTEAGRFLDSLSLSADQMPARAEGNAAPGRILRAAGEGHARCVSGRARPAAACRSRRTTAPCLWPPYP